MFYDPIWDKQHEECGVLGIYDKHLDIPRYIYWGCSHYSIVARKAAASP